MAGPFIASVTWDLTVEADGKLHSAQPADTTPPSKPGISLTAATAVGFTINLTTPSVDVQSGIASYLLEYSTSPFTAWSPIATIAPGAFPYVWSGAMSSTLYAVRATAIDASVNQNHSAPSTAVQLSTSSSGSSGIKWHPGWYMASNTLTYYVPGGGSNPAARHAEQDAANTVVACRGWQGHYLWKALEPTTLGVYDFSAILNDRNYIAAKANANRIWITIDIGQLGSTDGTFLVPTYISSNPGTYGACGDGVHGGYVRSTTKNLSYANLCNGPVRDRFIALVAALGAAFDPDPQVEIVSILGEDSLDVDAGSTNVTPANYLANLKLISAACIAAFPHTNWALSMNDGMSGALGWSETNEADLLTYVQSQRGGLTGPDVLGQSSLGAFPNFIYAQYIFKGLFGGYPDQRGHMAHFAQIEEPELDGTQFGAQGSPFTMADLFTNANGTLKASHIAVAYLASGTNNWTVVGAFMNANPITNLTPPY